MNARPTDRLAIAVAQLNPIVGDIAGNADKARQARAQAARAGADLVALPELFLSGYPPEDLVLKPALQAACRAAIEELARATGDGGPALMIGTPWLEDGKLPKTVSEFGATKEEIFVNYEDVKSIVGADEIKNIPLGAIGIYSYADKIKVGLQQLMAGARCFSVPAITRRELMSLNEECAKVTGIPYLMDAYREEAMKILES